MCIERCYQFSMFCNKYVILSSYIFIMATDQRSSLCIDINQCSYNNIVINKNLPPLFSSLHSACSAKIKLLFSSKWLQNLRVNSWQTFLLLHLHFPVSFFSKFYRIILSCIIVAPSNSRTLFEGLSLISAVCTPYATMNV